MEVIYVTKNNGKTLAGYTQDRYEKFKDTLVKAGYREATKAEIEARLGKLEPVIEPEPVVVPDPEPVIPEFNDTAIAEVDETPKPRKKKDSETSKKSDQ